MLRFLAQKGTKPLVAFPSSRRLLNVAYLALTPTQLDRFHELFAKMFRQGTVRGRSGSWRVKVAGKEILMPLSSSDFWLDWDSAVSIVGYDVDLKQTYESLIRSDTARPDVFVDVGANYGTHSLIFLCHGIRTLTFEPNASCHPHFQRMCQLNGVRPTLEGVALGSRRGSVTLAYPRTETWSGSTNADVAARLEHPESLEFVEVEQRTLDEYLSRIAGKKVLVKIDTEGNEEQVLTGASRVVQELRPMILFESLEEESRRRLFTLFDTYECDIFGLPWTPRTTSPPLTLEQVVSSEAQNFLALPRRTTVLRH
jgi:FkbM family methyltransferase